MSEAKPRPLCPMYCVYVLRWDCNNEFYIGYTRDLIKRIKQHESKGKFQLIYYEVYKSNQLAKLRERRLKYYGSAWRALKKRIA